MLCLQLHLSLLLTNVWTSASSRVVLDKARLHMALIQLIVGLAPGVCIASLVKSTVYSVTMLSATFE